MSAGTSWSTRLVNRLPDRVRETVRGWYRSLLMLLPTAARLPAVSVELRGWLPCWVLRLVAVGLALGSAALVIESPFGWLVVGVLAALILIRPGSPAAPILVVVLGFSLIQRSEQLWSVRGPLVLLGTQAFVILAVLLGATSWAARVQLRVFAPVALRFAVIQLIAQLVGALGALLAGRELSWPWIPVVAILVVLVLAALWIPRLRLPEAPPPTRIAADNSGARRWGED